MGHESLRCGAETHLVNGVLGYEAQLVNAVIASSSAIHGRFHYRYGGDWERCTRTKEITRDKTGKTESTPSLSAFVAGRMRTRSACSFRLVPFCGVNLKSPGRNLFTSPALLPAIPRCGFPTLNSKLLIWVLNIGLACTAGSDPRRVQP
ncbi:Gifsy-2 prophage RecT [Salmonella enterica subsp. enterica]|uniref:Gifsy-2 prophage RecT n=1 Tax=Salmonella enterica I TaxID=59201 RepID=A0A379W7S9_SALET|nr:Gifsy-2 prophage RecT [Salmonella enterica subsp. enterica]